MAAEAEVERVSGYFKDKAVYRGREATEGLFRRKSPQADVLHLAVHGEFNDRQPLQSGLLLAQDSEQNGPLQVHELFDLDLQGANLVVASACETALSRIQGGDDLVGLSRGFIYAGTPSLLATLWKVDDPATAQLMAGFYKNWRAQGMSKTEALRQAQQTLRAMPQYQHPYYWAPFVLIGDWR